MTDLRLAFTGTQHGMTVCQTRHVIVLLEKLQPRVVLHGDCIGADAEFHALVRTLSPKTRIDIYPGAEEGHPKRAGCDGDYIGIVRPPLARNKLMVLRTDMLIAAPKEVLEILRSGTWATIRYARELNRDIRMVLP